MSRSLVLLALGACLFAAETAPATPPATEAAPPKPYPLTTCVVMGGAVDKDSPSIVVEGQEFKVCCKGCIKPIKADPKAHLAKLAEAVKKLEKPAPAAAP